MKGFVIAIDGPAAAGKGTLAKRLANALGLAHLDTGLLYRAVARRMLTLGLDPERDDGEAVASSLRIADTVRDDLRTPEIDRAASLIATQPKVRQALLTCQREIGLQHGAVVDGRDIGTVVFPKANVKFYVTASAKTRALRRYRQNGGKVALEGQRLEEEISAVEARDQLDAGRTVAPLRRADDAIRLDTDEFTEEDVFRRAMDIVRARGFV